MRIMERLPEYFLKLLCRTVLWYTEQYMLNLITTRCPNDCRVEYEAICGTVYSELCNKVITNLQK